eukprot:TRINITY_DN16384_c0_g1_i1.p1 TRINITY_DN16384_c0_g1~~TRINITY_DN16384_c0_g1_i1.p1  ORF type:complete len:221 (+),score=38.39 TRINITY_DN16384_c0_g1_i1:77-664(+)
MPVAFATDDDRGVPPECRLPDGGFWVFGYGSILWKITFPVCDVKVGNIEGYSRRFCQGSADHRGTEEFPGRVVTLVEDTAAVTWGKALRVPGDKAEEVAEGLDHREKGGYISKAVEVTTREGEKITAMLYTSKPGSSNFISNEPIQKTAEIIAKSVGPSGPNTEYLFNVNIALRGLDLADPYCEDLEERVRSFMP